jgi:hypothetical protein
MNRSNQRCGSRRMARAAHEWNQRRRRCPQHHSIHTRSGSLAPIVLRLAEHECSPGVALRTRCSIVVTVRRPLQASENAEERLHGGAALPWCRRAPSVITAPTALQVSDRKRPASPHLARSGVAHALELGTEDRKVAICCAQHTATKESSGAAARRRCCHAEATVAASQIQTVPSGRTRTCGPSYLERVVPRQTVAFCPLDTTLPAVPPLARCGAGRI